MSDIQKILIVVLPNIMMEDLAKIDGHMLDDRGNSFTQKNLSKKV